MVDVAIVVAVAQNGVIGRDNALPWRLPNDLKYFKKITMGHPVVMGRRTYDSIGKPLPGRTNIVVTRQSHWSKEGVDVEHDLSSALVRAKRCEQGKTTERIMVIGGADLYAQVLPLCTHIYKTEVHADVEGDAIFPEIEPAQWRELFRERHEPCQRNPYAYSFVQYERVVNHLDAIAEELMTSVK